MYPQKLVRLGTPKCSWNYFSHNRSTGSQSDFTIPNV